LNIYQDTYKHKGLRKQLADLLRQKGIADETILQSVLVLPRHFFLPPEFEMHAYEDKAFPIGQEQTISQPYTVAYQTRLLGLSPGDKVLEIGTGSGYQGAILALCGADVYSIERIPVLSETAAKNIRRVNEQTGLNIHIKQFVGDGTRGLPAHAPYDKILVTAGAPSVPKALISQLKAGGQLVIPVGKINDVQRMVRITKAADESLKTEAFDDFSFVPLLGENGW
jgi:protein-L-isoaspartate(D-aspartate) O-methyltransferase